MTVALKSNAPMIVPAAVLRRAGFRRGQELEMKVSGGVITIIPRDTDADDEYTPAQRRVIDAALAKARKGPYHGPFETADAAISFLNKEVSKRSGSRRKTG